MCKRKAPKRYMSKWYKKYDGGYIMDEAPRTIFGTKRKINLDFLDNELESKPDKK